MKIYYNEGEIFCDPTCIEDIEIVSHFLEIKTCQTIVINFRKLEKIEEGKNSSIKGMFVGCLLDAQKHDKNVIIITREKIIGGILNSIII